MPTEGGKETADEDADATAHEHDASEDDNETSDDESQSIEILAERIASLQAERDRLKEEVAAFREKYLRARADYDNYAKRARRDADQAADTARAGILLRIIDAAENLDKAIGHFKKKGEDTTGLHLVLEDLNRTLKDHGVRTVKAEKVPFNYEHHTAVERVETDDADEGTVLKVHQRGYLLGEKVLRHAMVSVAAKPPAKPQDAAAEAPPGNAADGEAT